jgi:hypothetical protein
MSYEVPDFSGFLEELAIRIYRAEPDDDGMKETWTEYPREFQDLYRERAVEALFAACMKGPR